MKAIIYDKKNLNDKLVLNSIPIPNINDDQILIEIHASSINAADIRLFKMGFAPKKKIFGADISGTIHSMGKNISKFKIGDEVCGDISSEGFGGFAEYVAVSEKNLALKPKNISFEEAASLPMAGTTALQAICDIGKIQKGQIILIVGGSGGVGTFAIQLASYFGGIITCICSANHIDQAKKLGAIRTIDYRSDSIKFDPNTYDLIVAVNGNYPLTSYKKSLKARGKLVLVGGSLSQIFKNLFFGKLMSLGTKKMVNLFANPSSYNLSLLLNLVSENKIHPIIEKIYPLEKTMEAMRHIANGHATGKVIIKVK